MKTVNENNQEVINRLMAINAKFEHLKTNYGHEPLEPANQYCKHCGAALFTREYKTPCGFNMTKADFKGES